MDRQEAELCFPQLINTSCRKAQNPSSYATLSYILLSIISMLTVMLNMLVIIAISHYKQLHTPTNLLLLSLAATDLLVGFLMVLQIILIDGCWYFGDIACAVFYVSDYTITSVSIGTLVLISVDRYIAICDPLHYNTKVTQQRVKFCICLCWVCSALFHCARFKNNLEQPGRYNSCYGECILVIGYIEGVADLLMSFLCPLTVIILLYLQVFVVAASHIRATRSHLAVTLQCSMRITTIKSELKAAKTLGVVIVVFFICLCPYYCVGITGQDSIISASSAIFIIFMFYFNSCLNPIIYACFYPWFRKSVKLIVTLQILKTDSCNANILHINGG